MAGLDDIVDKMDDSVLIPGEVSKEFYESFKKSEEMGKGFSDRQKLLQNSKTNAEILKRELPGVYNDLCSWIESNLPRVKDKDEFINKMSSKEVLDTWLRWEGICGFTTTIYNILKYLPRNEEDE